MNTFLIAGHETTSGMLSFAVYFLLNNPHVMQKAYEEVDRVLGRDVNARPTAQQTNQLVYVGQILKEALRLWPTAPALGLYIDQLVRLLSRGPGVDVAAQHAIDLFVGLLH